MLEGLRARVVGLLRGSAIRLARAAETIEGDNTGVISPPEAHAPDVLQDPVTAEAQSMLLGELPLPAWRAPLDTIPDEVPPSTLREDREPRGHGPRVRVFRP